MNIQQNKLISSLGVGVGVSVLAFYIYRYIRTRRNDVMLPQEWTRVGVLAPLHIFPLKSGGELHLSQDTQMTCDVLTCCVGEIYDRSLMLVDLNNKMVTARAYPKMVLIECKMLRSRCLQFSMPEKPELQNLIVDYNTLVMDARARINVTIHTVTIEVVLCGEHFDTWFSRAVLDKATGLQLAYYPYEKPMKGVQTDMNKPHIIKPIDTGTLHDATSYHLINLSSVAELNTRTENLVKSIQFRANFEVIMDKPEPYAEENWYYIKIGDTAIFRNIAPCGRCIVPNIDHETGERMPKNQPLSVLKKYRTPKNQKAPNFGIHLAIHEPGKVKAGDVVYV